MRDLIQEYIKKLDENLKETENLMQKTLKADKDIGYKDTWWNFYRGKVQAYTEVFNDLIGLMEKV